MINPIVMWEVDLSYGKGFENVGRVKEFGDGEEGIIQFEWGYGPATVAYNIDGSLSREEAIARAWQLFSKEQG